MKFAIIPYIALGLVLSLVVGVEYNCEGQEMFPTYYGSPFVFKQKSLASSMEYFYSVSGLILNVMVWSAPLFFIEKAMQSLIQKVNRKKLISIPYKIIIGCMIAFTTLNIAIDSIMIGWGFNKGSNYWYWNIDKEAKDWGMDCEGEILIAGELTTTGTQ